MYGRLHIIAGCPIGHKALPCEFQILAWLRLSVFHLSLRLLAFRHTRTHTHREREKHNILKQTTNTIKPYF